MGPEGILKYCLDDQNINISHPGELLAALKAIGVSQLETCFGVGKKEKSAMRGRIPLRPTAIVREMDKQQAEIVEGIGNLSEKPLKGVHTIVAATDVHEFGKDIAKSVLEKAGAEVFDMGTNVAAEEITDAIIETESKALLISTYNGIAYSFAQAVMKKLQEQEINIPIIMGGRLNEIMEGRDTPEDVSQQLQAMGINVDNDIEKIVDYLTGALHTCA